MNKRKVEIWFQPTTLRKFKSGSGDRNRIRLVAANVVARYSDDRKGFCSGSYPISGFRCCWDNNCKSLADKVKAMHAYDEKNGFPKAVKIGEFYEHTRSEDNG